MTPENTGEIQGKFQKGKSGNPAGKPKGARHRTTLAVQALLDGEGETIARRAVEAAKAGDMVAIRLVLERVLPARKDNPVCFDLPAIDSADDAAKAMAAVMHAVADGELTPAEAGDISKLVETYVKTLETREFEKRLAALEERGAK